MANLVWEEKKWSHNDYLDLFDSIAGYYPRNSEDLAVMQKEKEMCETLDKLKKENDKLKKQKKTFSEVPYRIPSEPVKIIQNGPCVIVFWKDKTKTIVRKKSNDPDDIYSAVAQAFMKKWCGSTAHFHKCVDKMVIYRDTPKEAENDNKLHDVFENLRTNIEKSFDGLNFNFNKEENNDSP